MADEMLKKEGSATTSVPSIVSAAEVAAALPWKEFVPYLAMQLAQGGDAPLRHHHTFEGPGGASNTLLLMPAWRDNAGLGVKIVLVAPANGSVGLPAITSLYVLMDSATGAMSAVIDGGELTARRTAAVSAVAVSHLARKDARRHLIVGTGRLCRNVAQSHRSVRNFSSVAIWGRSIQAAENAADDIASICGTRPEVVTDLEMEVGRADVVTTVTLSSDPLVKGIWLKPGTHLDLIGGFTPAMRETDDDAISAGRIFVDAMTGAPIEAGDIVQPLQNGTLTMDGIEADLFQLCSGAVGRQSRDEITVFKSAGHALQDLAAAEMVAASLSQPVFEASGFQNGQDLLNNPSYQELSI